MIRRMIRGHLRFILRWHARLPFLAPLILCILFSLPMVFAVLLGDFMNEMAGGSTFGLEYLLTVITLLLFAPAVFCAFDLFIEDFWMFSGLYDIFGIQAHKVRDRLRNWASVNNEGTKP